jgi:hypothetical protein
MGRRTLWAAVVLLLGGYVLSAILLPSDQKRIEKLIENGRVACEREDVEAVMDLFDPAYRDDTGLTYAAWKVLFTQAFQRYDDVRLRVLDKKVDVNETSRTEATVTLTVRGEATVAATKGVAGAQVDRPIGQADGVEIVLRKTPTGWKVHSLKNLRETEW